MASQWLERKRPKNKPIYKWGGKKMEQWQNIGWCPNVKKPKEQMIKHT